MNNPWRALPRRRPFVLPEDAPFIREFNRDAGRHHEIKLGLMPEPFIGDLLNAPVVILALNPGVSDGDTKVNFSRAFRQAIRRGIELRPGSRRFYPLEGDPTRPGARWWRRNLKAVIETVGQERARERIACLEYFPYHSRGFNHAHLRLPSQEFTFGLLREAIRRRAVIVVTRGYRLWTGVAPDLASYRKLVRTRNPRSASISPKNCGAGFKAVIAALHRGQT